MKTIILFCLLIILMCSSCSSSRDIVTPFASAKSSPTMLVVNEESKKSKDYIKFHVHHSPAGYIESNWVATNTHDEKAIKFTIRFTTGGSIPRSFTKIFSLDPGDDKHVGYRVDSTGIFYSVRVVGARFIN